MPDPLLKRFDLGRLRLDDGSVVENAFLAYVTYGTLNAAADNCILIPTYYAGTHASYASMIGSGRVLDPSRYFIVVINLFGNGVSSSPSNMGADAAAGFGRFGIIDNVASQHRLLTEQLGVRGIALVTGWSMGAMQSHFWAALYPDMVRSMLAVCGASRCWPINRVFLDGLRACLRDDGNGMSARCRFARVYAGWAYSPAFFRDELYRQLGFSSVEELMTGWEQDHLAWHPADLLAMLESWESADIGTLAEDGDFRTALGRVRARAILMPCDEDRYFTLAENRIEAEAMANAEVRMLSSSYGHCAGAPNRFPAETTIIERTMGELLAP